MARSMLDGPRTTGRLLTGLEIGLIIALQAGHNVAAAVLIVVSVLDLTRILTRGRSG